MSFWSGERWLEELRAQKIIDPSNRKKIDCSAYTLTLGPESFVTPDYQVSARDNKKQSLLAPFEMKIGGEIQNIEGGELIIPAGQFAYLLSEEYVKIPKNVMGFISLKSRVKWLGLINVSGFHVDPGFEGRLIYSVYNAGPSSIHLNRGQDLFLLWLADLDRESAKPYVKSTPATPQNNIPSSMISNVDRRIHSLQGLSDEVKLINQKITFMLWTLGVVVPLLTIGLAVLARFQAN